MSVAGGGSMRHSEKQRAFDIAVVDEAAQMTEASSLIILAVSTCVPWALCVSKEAYRVCVSLGLFCITLCERSCA